MFVYEENERLISTNSWRNENCGPEEGFVHICKLYLQFSIPDHQGNIVRLHVRLTSVSFMKWNFASLPFSKHLEFRVNACRVLDKLVNTDHITANTQRKTSCKPNMSREVRNYDLRKLKIDAYEWAFYVFRSEKFDNNIRRCYSCARRDQSWCLATKPSWSPRSASKISGKNSR